MVDAGDIFELLYPVSIWSLSVRKVKELFIQVVKIFSRIEGALLGGCRQWRAYKSCCQRKADATKYTTDILNPFFPMNLPSPYCTCSSKWDLKYEVLVDC